MCLVSLNLFYEPETIDGEALEHFRIIDILRLLIRERDLGDVKMPYHIDQEKSKKGKSLLDFPDRFVCVDLETTGLSPQYDEIIEICAIKIANQQQIGSFHTLIKPQEEIDDYITELTGITNKMVSDSPSIEFVLPKLIEFIADEIVVGHNVSFDVNFIYYNYLEYYNKYFQNDYIDTMRLSKRLYPELPHHRLNDLIELFDIKTDGAHRANRDCEATVLCMNYLKKTALQKYETVDNFKRIFKKKKVSNREKTDLRNITARTTDFDVNNPLFKKNVVFTGTLEKMTRKEAAQLVVDFGGIAQNNITKNTDYLILGNNDYCSSIKNGKINKQKKAESLILNGSDLKIIPENVFYDIISEWLNNEEAYLV